MVAYTIAELAGEIGGDIQGESAHLIEGVATLANAQSSEISFLGNKKYRKFLVDTSAGCVLVHKDIAKQVKGNAIIVADPYVAYAKVANLLFPENQLKAQVHASAVISPGSECHPSAYIAENVLVESGVSVAENVEIGPGCVISEGVNIGPGTRLKANVTLCKGVTLGQRVIIHSGVVIGSDGFGIANDQGRWIKIPQLGNVQIGDDVEIGANTTIDRGALDDTIISNGVKLDNQIQIGHNVIVGEHTVIAGCVGIAGSTQIGAHCAIGGGTAIAGHITIADGVQLTGMSMVTKSINEAGSYSSGIPIEPTRQWHKNVIRYRKMADLIDRVKDLEAQLKHN